MPNDHVLQEFWTRPLNPNALPTRHSLIYVYKSVTNGRSSRSETTNIRHRDYSSSGNPLMNVHSRHRHKPSISHRVHPDIVSQGFAPLLPAPTFVSFISSSIVRVRVCVVREWSTLSSAEKNLRRAWLILLHKLNLNHEEADGAAPCAHLHPLHTWISAPMCRGTGHGHGHGAATTNCLPQVDSHFELLEIFPTSAFCALGNWSCFTCEGGNVVGDGLVGVRVFESKEMWEYLAGRVQGWTMHWIGHFVPKVWHLKERLIGTSEKQSWRSLMPAFQVRLEHWGSCSYIEPVLILDLPKYSV